MNILLRYYIMNLTVQYINYWKDPFNDRWLLKFIKHHFPNKNVLKKLTSIKRVDITKFIIWGWLC